MLQGERALTWLRIAPTIKDSRVSTTFVSSEWSHGMYYEDLPYFPLNQDPNRNLEGEIHDKMKDT